MADNMNGLAPVATMPTENEWHTIFNMAQQLVPTGFLPKAIDTPQKAAAIVLKGRELGVPPMYALSNIAVVQGKPVANAELMLALVKRAYGRDAIWVENSTPKVAKIGYLVHGKPRYYEFTIDMAKTAGLLNNQTYQKYPDAMLRARAISAVCRMEFPEVIGGMYVPGEMGEPVQVDESTGEIISVEVSAPEPNGREKAMKRLYAVAAECGITHDDLHMQAVSLGRESLADFDEETLNKTADAIKQRPEKAREYYEKLRNAAELERVNAEVNEIVDAEAAETAEEVRA